MCTNTSCCCQRCFTVWIRSNYARVQIFGPLLRGPDGASIIYDVPVVNVTSQKTYFKLGTLYSLNWKQGVTMTTWSVMSCCCDAPLNNPVTIICRWGIRFLTPGPKRHIRGVIIQWKLTGWYHSTSTALWGKHESIQYLLTETWYHSQESCYSPIHVLHRVMRNVKCQVSHAFSHPVVVAMLFFFKQIGATTDFLARLLWW